MEPLEWRDNILQRYGIEVDVDTRVRFLRSCQIENECWIWARRGRFSIGRKTFRPSEMAYLMLKGPLASNEIAETTCGNIKCCAPVHLVKVVYVEHSKQPSDIKQQNGLELAV